jgi:hypothetical protein
VAHLQIDIIVPTVSGREASLERCLDSFERTVRIAGLEAIIIRDPETCGAGWLVGLGMSTAPYVLLACDDQESLSDGWDEICIETADEGLIVCPRVWLADGTIESQGGDMGVLNHTISRPQRDRTPVNYTTIPFVSRAAIEEIGMIDVHYCSDVWVSYRGRQLGYETVLRHGFDVRHWREAPGRGAGMSVPERDALDQRTMQAKLDEYERTEVQAA